MSLNHILVCYESGRKRLFQWRMMAPRAFPCDTCGECNGFVLADARYLITICTRDFFSILRERKWIPLMNSEIE